MPGFVGPNEQDIASPIPEFPGQGANHSPQASPGHAPPAGGPDPVSATAARTPRGEKRSADVAPEELDKERRAAGDVELTQGIAAPHTEPTFMPGSCTVAAPYGQMMMPDGTLKPVAREGAPPAGETDDKIADAEDAAGPPHEPRRAGTASDEPLPDLPPLAQEIDPSQRPFASQASTVEYEQRSGETWILMKHVL